MIERSASSDHVVRALRELASEKPLRLRVEGTSMTPLALPGQCVEISRARFYLPGDVIAFRAGDGRLWLHRVLGYWPRGWRLGLVTRGDASPSYEAAFGLDDVVGKVRGGECSPLLAGVPVRHRLWAVGRFLALVGRRLIRRLG